MMNEQRDLLNTESNEDDIQKQIAIDEAIKLKQKGTDFDIREFPISVIVDKYTIELPEIGNRTEMFMPDYQREYKWSIKQQSEFIESLMIDLPIPYIYVADVSDGDDEGRIEIIDGSQRIRTLVRFSRDMFALEGLKLVPELNGIKFSHLSGSRKLRFNRKTVRFIELMDVDEEARRQIFYRLNSGGVKLNPMEIRYGTSDGEFLNFIKQLIETHKHKLKILAPLSDAKIKNREYEEMFLRFFAYRFDMKSYKKGVDSFLTDFMLKMNGGYQYKELQDKIQFNPEYFESIFIQMLDFVEEYFGPLYFKKLQNNISIARIRFEAISVGVSLALDTGKILNTNNILDWLDSNNFAILTESDASNSLPKLHDRTYFVVNHLTGDEWKPSSKAFIKALSGESKFPLLEQGTDDEEFGVQNELF